MKKSIILFFAFSLISIQNASAQEEKQISPLAEDKSPQMVPKGEIEALTTNCYTNVKGCEGYTTYGKFPYDVGCTVWYNDGANGHSNFTFRAGETREVYVRYNDTGACVAIKYAPPKYEGNRYYLFVHN